MGSFLCFGSFSLGRGRAAGEEREWRSHHRHLAVMFPSFPRLPCCRPPKPGTPRRGPPLPAWDLAMPHSPALALAIPALQRHVGHIHRSLMNVGRSREKQFRRLDAGAILDQAALFGQRVSVLKKEKKKVVTNRLVVRTGLCSPRGAGWPPGDAPLLCRSWGGQLAPP